MADSLLKRVRTNRAHGDYSGMTRKNDVMNELIDRIEKLRVQALHRR